MGSSRSRKSREKHGELGSHCPTVRFHKSEHESLARRDWRDSPIDLARFRETILLERPKGLECTTKFPPVALSSRQAGPATLDHGAEMA